MQQFNREAQYHRPEASQIHLSAAKEHQALPRKPRAGVLSSFLRSSGSVVMREGKVGCIQTKRSNNP